MTVAQFKAFVDDGREVGNLDALRDPATRPVRWVRWREALAYADWLTEKLRAWPHTPEPLASLLRDGTDGKPWRVTLPSEAEWEKAARGSDGRIYPWGGEPPDANLLNYVGTGIDTTSAVGCFRRGASPYKVEELSGNVWEWTRARYDGGREDLSASEGEHRAVRGGALSTCSGVRAAVRDRSLDAGHNVGFRAVASPFLSL